MDKRFSYMDTNTHEFTLFALSEAFDEIEKLQRKNRRLNRKVNLLICALGGVAYYLYSKKNKKEEVKTEEKIEDLIVEN